MKLKEALINSRTLLQDLKHAVARRRSPASDLFFERIEGLARFRFGVIAL
jgi:hypothetical protein